MKNVQDIGSSPNLRSQAKSEPGQVVLVLQGGGALGSYQAGVYQALHEAGIAPDWIIGTSIGAINAGLIAGNAPQNRLPRLREFWKKMEQNPVWSFRDIFPGFNEKLSYWSTVTHGIPGFFRPNALAHAGDPLRFKAGAAQRLKRAGLIGAKRAAALQHQHALGLCRRRGMRMRVVHHGIDADMSAQPSRQFTIASTGAAGVQIDNDQRSVDAKIRVQKTLYLVLGA